MGKTVGRIVALTALEAAGGAEATRVAGRARLVRGVNGRGLRPPDDAPHRTGEARIRSNERCSAPVVARSNDESSCVRVAWEGDFEALHSLAIVNRAVCRGLIDRGHDVRLIASSAGTAVEPDERLELDAQLRQRRLALPAPARRETRYPRSTPRCMCGIAGRR